MTEYPLWEPGDCWIQFLSVIAIFTKSFDLHQFLNNLVFFTKSLFITSTFIELLVQLSLQHLTTKDKYTFGKKEVFMTSCPCCTNPMLRHLRHSRVYWFCRQCWQEIPVYSLNSYGSLPSINL
ncbi:hypothetical protein QUA79_23020 [Microcoleus sp. F8-D1]